MNEIEQYEFDRQGYITIKNMLTDAEVQSLRKAVDKLEEHALSNVDLLPRKHSAWRAEYHVNKEKGYHVQGSCSEEKTLIIEDFWNADSTFDMLVNHEKTLPYVQTVIRGRGIFKSCG